MCLARDYIDNFVSSVEKAQNDYNKLEQELTKVNRQIVDLEHFIENEKFNVLQGFYFSASIKILRNRRRIIKNELETLQILNNNFSKLINIEFYKKIQNDITKKDNTLNSLVDNKTYNTRELHNIDKNNIKEFYNNLKGGA